MNVDVDYDDTNGLSKCAKEIVCETIVSITA